MRYVDRYLRMIMRRPMIMSSGKASNSMARIYVFNRDWKIVFRIRKAASSDFLSFNTAEISVYNMTATMRKELSTKGITVTLTAGYQELKDCIFEGTVNNVTTVKNGTDLITTFYCTGDTSAYSEGVSIAPRNITVTQLLANLCNEHGVPYKLPFNRSDIVSKSYIGTFSRVIALICHDYKISAGLDNGTLLFKDKNVTQEEVRVTDSIQLTPNTGMLGNPTVTQQGANVHAFIQPTIKVNDYFTLYAPYADYNLTNLTLTPGMVYGDNLNAIAHIDTHNYNGLYMALSIVHNGDTRGNSWYTDIQGSRIWPKGQNPNE